MNDNYESEIGSLAKNINDFAKRLKVDAFYTLIEVSDLVKKYAEIYTSKKPTSISGYNVLSAIVLSGGKLTATDISKQVFRSRYTVTRLIDTLEKQGMVVRRSIKNDRRMKYVFITKKGINLVERASADMKGAVINKAFDPLDKESVKELNNSLKALKSHLIYLISQNRQYSHYESFQKKLNETPKSKGKNPQNIISTTSSI
jgi:DNA-binding MarR family transcriptional regulator